MIKQKILVSALIAGGLLSPLAYATNGMNLAGYGPVAESMGGASMAYDNGTAAVMNNPATLGLMQEGSRVDAALGLLAPSITAKAGTAKADSSADQFFMPAVGYVKKSGQLAYGAAMFSQGGMGTTYNASTFMGAGSGQEARTLVSVGRFILPLAYQVNNNLTIGGSVDYVFAGMSLEMALSGAQFGDMVTALGGTQTYGSASGTMVSTLAGAFTGGLLTGLNWARVDFNNGSALGKARGGGGAFKLGLTYKVNNQLTLGATYHSKTSISDLTTSGATMSMNVVGPATGGVNTTVPVTGSVAVHNFQWPETYGFGAAYQATDRFLLVADYKHIGWAKAMQNFSMTFTADATQASPLAAGFGLGGQSTNMALIQNWSNQNVYEIGGAYKYTDALTLRAGLNMANNPVPDMYMNPLFPAIARDHISLGAGYAFSKASSLDFSYMYVPKTSNTNAQGVTVDFGGYSGQLMYSYRF